MNKIDLNLLKLLHKYQNNFISGEKISYELGVSRTTIWKHVKYLKEEGYQIDSSPNKGYNLVRVSEKIIPEEVYLGLKTAYIGKEIQVFPRINSTNEKAKELARSGAASGTVVIAEEQTCGKGRLGRNWFSPSETGLWFSLILRPNIPPERAPFLTIIASLALVTALKNLAPNLSLTIKWPNDIILNKKKVCGILSELNSDLGAINFAIIGIGLNVNQKVFPDELKSLATSLRIALGAKIDRTDLLQKILFSFEFYYQKLLDGMFNDLLTEWKSYLNILGRLVNVVNGKDIYQGKVIDISSKGELVIKDDQGEIYSFWAGDVSLRNENLDKYNF